MMQAMIVDDEPLARARLERFLSDEDGIEVRWVCEDGEAAVRVLQKEVVDVLFLDIQMPGLDGFGVLKHMRDAPLPSIVFVTAYEHYAIRAFQAEALDYLVKPFDQPAFRKVVARVRQQRHLHQEAAFAEKVRAVLPHVMTSPSYPRRLSLRQGKAILPLETATIDWIEATGNYVTLHVGSAAYLYAKTMQEMERILNPADFCRIHRSTIVNVNRIRALQPLFRGEYAVILKDSTQLKLTRTYRSNMLAFLGTDAL